MDELDRTCGFTMEGLGFLVLLNTKLSMSFFTKSQKFLDTTRTKTISPSLHDSKSKFCGSLFKFFWFLNFHL